MPQYPLLPSPEYNIGLQVLLPKMPQYQRLPPPEPNNRDQIQMGEDNIVFSLETSHQRSLARSVQTGVSLKNQQKIGRKRKNIGEPILTTEALRILLPTTPQGQKLPSLESGELEKASSVSVAASEEINTIRTLCRKYHKDDIYNMDETLLHWRHALYPTFAPKEMEDISQMTLALCVNSSGSDKLPVWVITSEEKPVSLCELDTRAFGAVWHSRKNSTMTAEAMREWLRHFYSHIGKRRSVILLLDNAASHHKGVELAPAPSNIRIQWIPPKTTLSYQPLDQGIIRAVKDDYRQIWMNYVIAKMYGGQYINPIHAMSSELAARWIAQIWKHHVTSNTIRDCFYRSSILQSQQPSPLVSRDLPDPTAPPCGFVDLSEYI